MRPMTLISHVWITIMIWGITIGVALATSNVGTVLELVGAVCATNLGYTFPSLLYIKVHSNEIRDGLTTWNKNSPTYNPSLVGRIGSLKSFYLPAFIVVFGVAIMFIGTATTFIYD